MTCERCGGDDAFSIKEDGSTSVVCGICLDKRYPELRLGTLTRPLQRTRTFGICPHCGWTTERAKKNGLVGCPLCYEALDPAIWPDFGIHLVEN